MLKIQKLGSVTPCMNNQLSCFAPHLQILFHIYICNPNTLGMLMPVKFNTI